ncbi:MAG: DUF2336 domain-containing protein [Alphaproteobacteria bacterium]|nr:DUF2336 domain-containing protein [Alphaproteobacteria bacterium]
MSAADQRAEAVDNKELLSLKVLAENRAVFARSSLFERVSSLLFEGEGELRPEVRTLIDEILVGLIGQVEQQIRQKVAARISALTAPPLALTRLLASDEISVAGPILEKSAALTERDLLTIIAEATSAHRQAIAKRSALSASISAALVAKQETKVVEALLANAGAVIPAEVFEDLVALSKSVESIRKPLLLRGDLPKDLAHQMFWWVTAALRHVILERFAIDAKELDAILGSILHETRMRRALNAAPEFQWRQGELNAILARLKQGDVKGFTEGLAKIANISLDSAARVVSDPSGEPMVLLAKAIGADRAQITSIFLQLDFKRHGKARPLAQIETIAKLYDTVSLDRAKATVALWDAQIVASAA